MVIGYRHCSALVRNVHGRRVLCGGNYANNKYPEMLGGVRFKKRDLQFTPGLVLEE
jgi:hypothetical protein